MDKNAVPDYKLRPPLLGKGLQVLVALWVLGAGLAAVGVSAWIWVWPVIPLTVFLLVGMVELLERLPELLPRLWHFVGGLLLLPFKGAVHLVDKLCGGRYPS